MEQGNANDCHYLAKAASLVRFRPSMAVFVVLLLEKIYKLFIVFIYSADPAEFIFFTFPVRYSAISGARLPDQLWFIFLRKHK